MNVKFVFLLSACVIFVPICFLLLVILRIFFLDLCLDVSFQSSLLIYCRKEQRELKVMLQDTMAYYFS